MTSIRSYVGAAAHLGDFREHMTALEREALQRLAALDQSVGELRRMKKDVESELAAMRSELSAMSAEVGALASKRAELEQVLREPGTHVSTVAPTGPLSAADLIRAVTRLLVSVPVSLRTLSRRVDALEQGRSE